MRILQEPSGSDNSEHHRDWPPGWTKP